VCFGTQLVMRRGTDTLRAESASPADLRRSRAAPRVQKAILKLNSSLVFSAHPLGRASPYSIAALPVSAKRAARHTRSVSDRRRAIK
jgi:hypothetical protein